MNGISRQWIEGLHASGRRFVLALSGGGCQAIADLLTMPGGSRSILEAVIPYSTAAMNDWLGGMPNSYCAACTARAMAMAAFQRARQLVPEDDPHTLVGIGCTASLASNRPKRGPHRIHVAWQTSRQTGVDSLELIKGMRDRAGEEEVTAIMVLATMARGADMSQCEAHPLLPVGLDSHIRIARPEWTELLLGERDMVAPRNVSSCIFPGAFNPPHSGHLRMAEIAAARRGEPVWFELSITNVDKRPLDFIEIAYRLDGLGDVPTILTRATRFTEKARLFPGAMFVVGTDTMARISDPRYYAGDPTKVVKAMQTMSTQGCRFLVFGRTEGKQFVGLEDLVLPSDLRALCEGVPESDFREDVSSTEKRTRNVKRAV